jgi:hypothetical protein
MCFFNILYNIYLNISDYDEFSEVSYKYLSSSCKIPVILAKFLWHLNLSTDFEKNIEINFVEALLVGANLFCAGGQTGKYTSI